MWERRANQIQIFGNVWANTTTFKKEANWWVKTENIEFCCVKCEENKNSEICNQILKLKIELENLEAESESRLDVFEVFEVWSVVLEIVEFQISYDRDWKTWFFFDNSFESKRIPFTIWRLGTQKKNKIFNKILINLLLK